MKTIAYWSDRTDKFELPVETTVEALKLFDELTRRTDRDPTLLEFWGENGLALCVGIGREVSVITYQTSLEPPYYISLGSVSNESAWFCYGMEPTEHIASNLVLPITARDAARLFFDRDGQQPDNLEWERL